MTRKISILWVDDEIDLLRSHILFLEEKGYEVDTVNSGEEALERVTRSRFDLIFLDEHMPGLSGLETLEKVKDIQPAIPVIMITKSEEEDIMDEAIGSKIADYLIKPVNPKQILLAVKKNLDTKRLINQKITSEYQSQFSQIAIQIQSASSFEEWNAVYRKLVFWEQELGANAEGGMQEVLSMQWSDANNGFQKFIKGNYQGWFQKDASERPVLSPMVFEKYLFPELEVSKKLAVIVVDNLRFDQWKIIEQQINDWYEVDAEHLYCSILPTSTQYARNAMFAGLMPMEIKRIAPDLWVEEEEEESKNQFEAELLKLQMKRKGIDATMHYEKISSLRHGKRVMERVNDLKQYDLNILVYNFVDMLSHARTEMDVIKELAHDEKAYRDVTLSWFSNSYLKEMIQWFSENGIRLAITTDHGAVRVQNPVKVVGDRKSSANLRYKQGRNLSYPQKEVYAVTDPEKIFLPKTNVSTSYIFASNYDYMVYPNNYNTFVHHFRNTFQHGGISMEEMLVPCIILEPK